MHSDSESRTALFDLVELVILFFFLVLVWGVLAMSRISLLLGICLCVSCGPTVSSTKKDQPIYDVAWISLSNDYHTANSYRNQRVRIRIDASDYEVVGNSIQVYLGKKATPCFIKCDCREVPPSKSNLIISGTCLGPTRDGIWRSPRTDFYITVVDCVVSSR